MHLRRDAGLAERQIAVDAVFYRNYRIVRGVEEIGRRSPTGYLSLVRE